MTKHKKLNRFRRFLMYFWVMVMPITFNWMSPVIIVMAGFEGYISLSFIVFSVWFVSSLFFGRAYCAYGCQWGAAQEVLGNVLPKKLDSNKKNRNRKIKYAVFVFWILMIAIGPIMLGGFVNGINFFYPNSPTDISGLISFDGSVIGLLIIYYAILGTVVILFVLVGGNRAFCNYACPMSILGIIGTKIENILKYPSLHLEADSKKCTNCKLCTRSCPMSLEVNDLVNSGDMYDPDCILCGNCVSTCNSDVIHYAWKWKK